MGWTSYNASHYSNGKVDIMEECKAIFMEGLDAGSFEIVDCALRGNVWYGAIKRIRRSIWEDGKFVRHEDIPEDEQEVYGEVVLTHIDNNDYYNFSYKDMSEDMGPYESKCPKRIINKLSPTTNEYALAWRKRCMEAKNSNELSKLPIGTVIEFEYDGKIMIARKMTPNHQFRTAWYYIFERNTYFPKRDIPKDFKVVEYV